MSDFRLSYPAHIYATIHATDVHTARVKLTHILDGLHGGIVIHLDGVDKLPRGNLYPDSGLDGKIDPTLIELEGISDDSAGGDGGDQPLPR